MPSGYRIRIGQGSQQPYRTTQEEEPRMRMAGIPTDLQQNACHLLNLSNDAMLASHRFI